MKSATKPNFVKRTLAAMLTQSGISIDEAYSILDDFKDDTITSLKILLDLARDYPPALIRGIVRSRETMRELGNKN
jgi:hypothetical protein